MALVFISVPASVNVCMHCAHSSRLAAVDKFVKGDHAALHDWLLDAKIHMLEPEINKYDVHDFYTYLCFLESPSKQS